MPRKWKAVVARARSGASYLKIMGGVAQVSLAAYDIPAELPPGDRAGRMLTLRTPNPACTSSG